jgi:hypothetical protein
MNSRPGCTAAIACFTWASVAIAQPLGERILPSCVAGSPPLRVASSAEQAWLHAADRKLFDEAAQARYALYQRGGLVPSQVLMLKRGRHWLYVTLGQRGASGICFTAVFAADRFDFTPDWIARYAPRAVQPDD